jgi:hypothetical protein
MGVTAAHATAPQRAGISVTPAVSLASSLMAWCSMSSDIFRCDNRGALLHGMILCAWATLHRVGLPAL